MTASRTERCHVRTALESARRSPSPRSGRQRYGWILAIALMGAAASTPAHASEYGCTVLLCLANPNGPRAVAPCVPPINRLFRDLARGRGLPSCPMARQPGPNGGRAWAQEGQSHYDPCPAGTTPLRRGEMAAFGLNVGEHYSGPVLMGIGDGDELERPNHDNGPEMPAKICVGQHIGTTLITSTYGDGGLYTTRIGVYHPVVILDAAESPRVIDVYINDALYRRVRW